MSGQARERLAELARKLDGKCSWPHVSELVCDDPWTFEGDEAEYVSLAAPRHVATLITQVESLTLEHDRLREALDDQQERWLAEAERIRRLGNEMMGAGLESVAHQLAALRALAAGTETPRLLSEFGLCDQGCGSLVANDGVCSRCLAALAAGTEPKRLTVRPFDQPNPMWADKNPPAAGTEKP